MAQDIARLFELFDWENRDVMYHVTFDDGEEYELTRVIAAQDIGEPPHGTASVARSIRTRAGVPFPERNAMFFRLSHVSVVTEAANGDVLYRAR